MDYDETSTSPYSNHLLRLHVADELLIRSKGVGMSVLHICHFSLLTHVTFMLMREKSLNQALGVGNPLLSGHSRSLVLDITRNDRNL